MIKLFDKLFFLGPVGLGDTFVQSGIVNHFADRSHELHVPAQPKFYKTVKTLYKDHPNIKVIALEPDENQIIQYAQANGLSRILPIPLSQTSIKNFQIIPMWDIQTYANFELSFGLRYSNFRLPNYIEGSDKLYDILSNNQPYILIHRYTGDNPDGIPINIQAFRQNAGLKEDVRIIEIKEGITDDMMQYVKLIQEAEEIHCVPSSFHCLVDSIQTNAKLYFHDIREKTSMAVNTPWNNFKWTEVHYNERL
jgi:hypothetical protein